MTRHPLSHRQARQLMDTAYLAAATALLWIALYYLPVGSPLFRLALPLPLALLQLRHGWRCAVEGVVVTALLLLAMAQMKKWGKISKQRQRLCHTQPTNVTKREDCSPFDPSMPPPQHDIVDRHITPSRPGVHRSLTVQMDFVWMITVC